jgi:4,5-dihydroxyphthalate decarboxylase
MKKISLSIACAAYDRTRAIWDGRTKIDGVELICSAIEPEEAFHRAFKFAEFDITEISMSSHAMMTSRGQSEYVGIPIFLSRVFRHSGIYVRNDGRIRKPADLVGKIVGLPEYQITANVWIRGILKDDFGVLPETIRWRRGGVEEPGRGERAPITLPENIELQQIPDDKCLSGMLETGEIDAVIGARAPSCFLRGAPGVSRLFENYRDVEEDYFKRTRIFPIMHMVGIRKALVEQYPWLPVNVYKAFLAAKEIATHDLSEICHLMVTLPWAAQQWELAQDLMGRDYWPYGFDKNKHVLDAFLKYHYEQGLSARLISSAELFCPSTLEISKI